MNLLRMTAYMAVIALIGAYAAGVLRGPEGIPALMEKREEIRAVQEKNADLAKEIQQKRDRIERLRSSKAEQELEIRERLKLLRKGETSFILPDRPKAE